MRSSSTKSYKTWKRNVRYVKYRIYLQYLRKLDFFAGRAKSLAADLILSLALKVVTESDIETLSKDSRYVELLEEIKKNLDEKYLKLLDLNQNI
jgi:hypothetical protein